MCQITICIHYSEGFFDGIGRFNGRWSNRFIEMIGKQGFKLQSEKPSFGQQCNMLFDDGEEMGNGVLFGRTTASPSRGPHLVPTI